MFAKPITDAKNLRKTLRKINREIDQDQDERFADRVYYCPICGTPEEPDGFGCGCYDELHWGTD